ncbi:MAG: hypothetical protein AAFZ58_00645 [Pseudomonadota bacterium]
MVRATLVFAALLVGCASGSPNDPAAFERAVAECMENAEMREGESLGNSFRIRATRAHCEKAVLAETDDG